MTGLQKPKSLLPDIMRPSILVGYMAIIEMRCRYSPASPASTLLHPSHFKPTRPQPSARRTVTGSTPHMPPSLALSAVPPRILPRNLRGSPPRWSHLSSIYRRRLANQPSRDCSPGCKLRHLWDLRSHGENQIIAHPTQKNDDGRCPL